VIDEWAGLFVALCGVDLFSFGQVVIALVGFRLFDIVKPGPVAWAERLPGAIGVMADDIVAGGLVFLGFVVCGVI
jgi:phosphatidylglycerophosphatase A